MTSEERRKQQAELIEATGRHYDKKGFQPTAGRILGLLTVMDKERFTFDEIVEELKISKSSASTAIRMLEIGNVIEYITVPGERKRYFQLKKLDRFALIDEHKINLAIARDYFRKVLELKINKSSENSIFIKNMIHMLNFFLKKFDELKKEYIAENERLTKVSLPR